MVVNKNHILNCVRDISQWMSDNSLMLNEGKTEIIFFGSRRQLSKLDLTEIDLLIGSNKIIPSTVVRNLGVWQDQLLDMSTHVSEVCKACYKQLYCIKRIRPFLTVKATEDLVRALVTSRIDYCNSLLSGLTQKSLGMLQRVQNFSARIVLQLPRRAHITPAFYCLHWLPVELRIPFKLLSLVFQCLNGLAPDYLKSLLVHHVPVRPLRSSENLLELDVPQFRTETYGRARFSVMAPVLWNSLPIELRNCLTISQFKVHLKTYFMRQYFTQQRFEHLE